MEGLSLQIDRSATDRKKIFGQEVNGATPKSRNLWCNDADLASEVWAELGN